jgi:hypothetical protein
VNRPDEPSAYPWIYLNTATIAFVAIIFSYVFYTTGVEMVGNNLLYGGTFIFAIGIVLHIYCFITMRNG